MKYLLEYLEENARSDVYPFHMPGHKRKKIPFANPYEMDITEIDGFDNLHHASGILKEAQERAAGLYGAERSFYLVNGSTCGLLAAICAAAGKGNTVIVARNCHKAVYHALYLNELRPEYLYPVITENGIQGQITAEQVEKALCKKEDAAAVIITSPTYEGIVSDVGKIANVCHKHKVPLIVDEAHGAHFGFGADFPQNAVKLGADAVIMSLHKTLPSFTQTALLHLHSGLIREDEVERYLGIFETSSPSYLFMAGMDECVRLVAENGAELFEKYRSRLNDFYEKTKDLQKLHVMRRSDLSVREAYDWDDSKIVIFSGEAGMTGEQLHEILLHRYHLQMEMVSGYYVLGMTSMMDDSSGFLRLAAALREIDASVREKPRKDASGYKAANEFLSRIYEKREQRMQSCEVYRFLHREVSLKEAVGKVSADTVFLYPPGIPFLLPGEVITKQLAENIEECLKMGLCVEGAANIAHGKIKIAVTE